MPSAALWAVSVLIVTSAGPAAQPITLVERLEILASTYKDHIIATDATSLTLRGGARLVIDDGHIKSHAEKLTGADIEDMLSQIYPLGACVLGTPPAVDDDPGRIRNEAFFRAVYGDSARAVMADTVRVDWFGASVAVTRIMGVDKALASVARDLADAPPAVRRMLAPSAGTFNWRVIAGTSQLSVHSFAAAIDVNTEFADYWRWQGGRPGHVPRYRNRIAPAIVAAFERHGFVWGGKWYHYDTMHFEYRPELIAIGQLAAERGCPR